jgi:hypothetical protein
VKSAEVARGACFDRDAGRVPLGEQTTKWIAERPPLSRRTDREERAVVAAARRAGAERGRPDRRHASARGTWRAGLLAAGIGPSTVAGAYRPLRAVMNTALDDELIRRRNPCRITGAHQERSPERPTASVEQDYVIAVAIKRWCRALVLTAGTTGLRWGGLVGLRRRHVDLAAGFLSVEASVIEVGSSPGLARTKSAPGVRTVGLPAVIVPELRDHVDRWADAALDGRASADSSLLTRGEVGKTTLTMGSPLRCQAESAGTAHQQVSQRALQANRTEKRCSAAIHLTRLGDLADSSSGAQPATSPSRLKTRQALPER